MADCTLTDLPAPLGPKRKDGAVLTALLGLSRERKVLKIFISSPPKEKHPHIFASALDYVKISLAYMVFHVVRLIGTLSSNHSADYARFSYRFAGALPQCHSQYHSFVHKL
jgi:hypothetical protein